MQPGLRETVGGVKDLTALGPDIANLVQDKAGQPRKTSWNFVQVEAANCRLDISSPCTRTFLEEFTTNIGNGASGLPSYHSRAWR